MTYRAGNWFSSDADSCLHFQSIGCSSSQLCDLWLLQRHYRHPFLKGMILTRIRLSRVKFSPTYMLVRIGGLPFSNKSSFSSYTIQLSFCWVIWLLFALALYLGTDRPGGLSKSVLKSGMRDQQACKKSGDFVANECRYNRCTYNYIR